MQYGLDHQHDTVENFFQFVHFTDETHFDPDQTYNQLVLREEGLIWIIQQLNIMFIYETGIKYKFENMQLMSDMKGVKLHVAASISWHHKSALQFYNDEHDKPSIQIKKPSKPCKSKYETADNHCQLLADWEASLPYDVDVKPKGNSITQAYYTEQLLPVYVDEIQSCRIQHDRECKFQENNDPSHGIKSVDNIARRFKINNWIETLIYSSQSLDLNPIEGIWNILKQRVSKHRCSNVAELKRIILIEWKAISMEEIWARIKEMPDRCKQMIASKETPIKLVLW